jgi:hypothetical protein
MPNKRISELDDSGPLYFDDVSFNTGYTVPTEYDPSDDWYFMVARPKLRNEKLPFSGLQASVLTDAISLSGSQIISGQKTFKDECHITKRANIHSISDPSAEGPISGYDFAAKTGYYQNITLNNEDYSGDHAVYAAGTSFVAGDLMISGNQNSEDQSIISGTLNVNKESYSDSAYLLNENEYTRIYGGDDESVVFKTNLRSGYKNFTVPLPKTFHEKPVICTSLQHSGSGVAHILKDTTENEFNIKTEDILHDDNFVLHTTAMAPSNAFFTSNKAGFHRFKSDLPSGQSSQLINFPSPHNFKPMVNVSIEGENHVTNYAISGVNTGDYTIFLSNSSQEDYIIHTISTEDNSQRIS